LPSDGEKHKERAGRSYPTVEIRVEDPTSAAAAELLREHLDDMAHHSPPESIRALDLGKLRGPEIIFWSAWSGDELAPAPSRSWALTTARSSPGAPPNRTGVKGSHQAAEHHLGRGEAKGVREGEFGDGTDGSLRSGPGAVRKVRLRGVPASRRLRRRPLERLHDERAVNSPGQRTVAFSSARLVRSRATPKTSPNFAMTFSLTACISRGLPAIFCMEVILFGSSPQGLISLK